MRETLPLPSPPLLQFPPALTPLGRRGLMQFRPARRTLERTINGGPGASESAKHVQRRSQAAVQQVLPRKNIKGIGSARRRWELAATAAVAVVRAGAAVAFVSTERWKATGTALVRTHGSRSENCTLNGIRGRGFPSISSGNRQSIPFVSLSACCLSARVCNATAFIFYPMRMRLSAPCCTFLSPPPLVKFCCSDVLVFAFLLQLCRCSSHKFSRPADDVLDWQPVYVYYRAWLEPDRLMWRTQSHTQTS